jgi:hypothetical protein
MSKPETPATDAVHLSENAKPNLSNNGPEVAPIPRRTSRMQSLRRIEFRGIPAARQPFWRFAVETICVTGLLFVFWQFSKLVSLPFVTPAIMRVVNSDNEADVLSLYTAAILLLSSLVYYGTSFIVTPASVLRAMLPRIRSADMAIGHTAEAASERLVVGGVAGDGAEPDVGLDQGSPEAILEASAHSASRLAQRMERRTNTHLILGLTMGVIGLVVWYASFSLGAAADSRLYDPYRMMDAARTLQAQSRSLSDQISDARAIRQSPAISKQLAGIEDTLSSEDTLLKAVLNPRPAEISWAELLRTFVPRITILAFIEILAGFFLQQYRVGVEDLKYFLEVERTASARRIAYAIYQEGVVPDHLLTFAKDILSEASSVRLKAGETTTSLETLKAEKNVALEALSVVGDRLKGTLSPKKGRQE